MKRLIVFLLLAAAAAAANAVAPTPQPPLPPGTMDSVLASINTVINTAFTDILTSSNLKEAGAQLSFWLAGLMMVWLLLKSMLEGSGFTDIVAGFIVTMASMGIVYWLIDIDGVGKILGFMDWVAARFGAPETLSDMISISLTQTFEAAWQVASAPSLNSGVPFSWDTAIPIVASTIVRFAMQAVTALLIVVAGAIYVANVILAHGSIMLAVALAPIMIPFIIVESLNFIFYGWLRFTISAGLMKVVGTFLFSFCTRLMDQLVVLSSKLQFPPNTDAIQLLSSNLLYYSALGLIGLLCAWTMAQTPSLANGLMSGAGGAGMNVRLGAMAARAPNLAPLTAKIGELASSIAAAFKK